MIKAVVFDIGNVLLHFDWQNYLERNFPDPDVRKELAESVFLSKEWQEGDRVDMPLEQWQQRYIDNAPHLEKEIRQICSNLPDLFSVFPYTEDWIDSMHKSGYKVYFLSNFCRAAYEQAQELISFTKLMDGGLFSFQEGLTKPDPAFYKLLCERYDLKPEELFFYDDLKENVEAAMQVGMQGVTVTNEMMEKESAWYGMTTGGKDKMLKVVKFGGSSLASSGQFHKVKDIIEYEDSRRYVIPSAPGKRDSNDTKVTDLLYRCYAYAKKGKDYKSVIAQIRLRYEQIIDELGLDISLDDDFRKIEEYVLKDDSRDFIASRGEYLNGKILAAYLNIDFIDAADIICFTSKGEYEPRATKELVKAALANHERAVIPGFYGADKSGKVHTFSRGGSDITGAIIAGAIGADMYENWTDVSGVLVADPTVVEDPAPIEVITYRELRELSYMGAAVLHEDAIFPVKEAGIPINIRNTNRPKDRGTMIVEMTCWPSPYVMTGVAGKKGFVGISIEKERMNDIVGYCRSVLDVFAKYDINIEHMPSGIDTMSVFVHQHEFLKKEQKVLADIQEAVAIDHLELESDVALIAVVGRGMRSMRGTAGRVFAALANANVNIRMIDQGSSELNIIIGVHSQDFESAIRAIYNAFVGPKKS